MKNKAFTLIELLVVVLIIGILTAIALPMYKTAVAKARFMQIVTVAHKLAEAQRRYYLANGKYAVDLDDLDIQIPGKRHDTKLGEVSVRGGTCFIDYYHTGNPTIVGCDFSRPRSYYQVRYSNNQRHCYSYSSDNYAADQLCKSMFSGEGEDGCNGGCHIWTED